MYYDCIIIYIYIYIKYYLYILYILNVRLAFSTSQTGVVEPKPFSILCIF